MLTKTIAAALAVAVGTTTIVSAASINQRESRQAWRIYKGIKNNRLTFNEARALVRGQIRVHAMEARARADGYIDPWERQQIQNFQDYQSARIWYQKHN